ncbi:hypothetical protein B5F39_00510 [Cloacibacillus sp. An23]|nr:hypothetical protein B5F39_00510 [Cloacibacillus sp. An23]
MRGFPNARGPQGRDGVRGASPRPDDAPDFFVVPGFSEKFRRAHKKRRVPRRGATARCLREYVAARRAA